MSPWAAYVDLLARLNFRRNRAGELTFRPGGLLGRAYRVETQAQHARLEAEARRVSRLFVPGLVALALAPSLLALLGLRALHAEAVPLALFLLWRLWLTRRLCRAAAGLPVGRR